MDVSLLGSALVSCLAFVFLIWVGRVVIARPAASRRARTATATFAAWWWALAAYTGTTGITEFLAATTDPPLTLIVGLEFIGVAAVCMGLAGLLYYLVYLYTGRTAMLWPLIAFYAGGAGALIRAMAAWEPVGVVTSTWEAEVAFARQPSEASMLALLMLLIGPQLASSVALFVLAARLPHSAARVRLLVVASAVFLWFGSALLASAAGATEHTTWQLFQLWTPVLVGFSVWLVYRPPAWLASRMPPELPTDAPISIRRSPE